MDNQAVESYMKEQVRQEGRQEGIRIGQEKGIQIGEEKGKTERNIEITKAMLQDGDPLEKIVRNTGLPPSRIQELT